MSDRVPPKTVPVPVGRPSFLDVPRCENLETLDADIAIVAFPYTVPYTIEWSRQPSSWAPGAIREASLRYPSFLTHYDMPHVKSLTQVGIRSLRNTQTMMEDSLQDGNRVVTMEEFRDVSYRGFLDRIPRDARVYVSLDIDVLDLPLVPGCVSAEPNGLLYPELRKTLFALAEHAEIVGFDLVEVNPMLDVGTGITSYLAAHTIVEFLGRICDQPRWIASRDARAARREEAARRRRDGDPGA